MRVRHDFMRGVSIIRTCKWFLNQNVDIKSFTGFYIRMQACLAVMNIWKQLELSLLIHWLILPLSTDNTTIFQPLYIGFCRSRLDSKDSELNPLFLYLVWFFSRSTSICIKPEATMVKCSDISTSAIYLGSIQ